MADISYLKSVYSEKRGEIISRLKTFKNTMKKGDAYVFSELCFCLLTPQSKAEKCDAIIRELVKNRYLFRASEKNLRPYLRNARFYKNKAHYIISARRLFSKAGRLRIKDMLPAGNAYEVRDWLVKHVKGMGFKEASHFLRNIGKGEDLGILDVHILKNLKYFGIIRSIPKALTKKKYIRLESRLRSFSAGIGIPLAHLDLLFWSMETGKIFK